jgi:ferredoxin
VINLCKMKTHSFMYATGAVKNSFGVIHGLHKPGYHAKLQDTSRFAKMLLDLSNFVAPRLSIMDAVVAMEGEGPGMGDPRPVGLLLAAREPLALDVIAGEIMGLSRDNNPVLLAAEEMGQLPNRLDEVRLIGADIDELRIPDYKFPATVFGGTGFGDLNWWQRAMEPLFKDGMSVKPKVIRKSCTACGACKEACPMDCIKLIPKEYAEINDKHCIRCYCCHEMCAFESIELKRSLLHRLMNR